MNNVQYFGRGPEENYIDRNHGTLVGVYKTTADKMYFNYVRPQENGHHTDTRWIALSPDKGMVWLLLPTALSASTLYATLSKISIWKKPFPTPINGITSAPKRLPTMTKRLRVMY